MGFAPNGDGMMDGRAGTGDTSLCPDIQSAYGPLVTRASVKARKREETREKLFTRFGNFDEIFSIIKGTCYPRHMIVIW